MSGWDQALLFYLFLSGVTTQVHDQNINDRSLKPRGNSAAFKSQSAPERVACVTGILPSLRYTRTLPAGENSVFAI